MGTWNLGWQGANDRRTHYSHGKWGPESEIVAPRATGRKIRDRVTSLRNCVGPKKKTCKAENLEATIVTQQDQGPSGHRRVYLTTEVVARHAWCNAWLQWLCRFGTTHRSLSSAIGKGIGRQKEQILSKRQFDQSLTLPPSPTAMPTQNFQNEQMDSPMELGAQERIERKGARPSETPTSVISGRPVVKARPASPPMIVPMVEGSGTVVFSALVSSSKDEMTMSGLYVIDWIDVVATLVPEEDVWQFEATEVRMTPGKKIWSKWVETRKDPNSPAVQCRLCATEVNTGESRSDTFAATPPLKFVRLILTWAASYKPKRANASMIIAVFDIFGGVAN